MPPHLHPRSTATSTLFVGTLLASFTVVAIPHIFPCPRPRRAYADAERNLDPEGRPVRRKKRPKVDDEQHEPQTQETRAGVPAAAATSGSGSNATTPSVRDKDDRRRIEDEAALFRQFQEEAKMLEREAHECPVPKPGGVLGRLLGFQQDGDERNDAIRDRRKDASDVR